MDGSTGSGLDQVVHDKEPSRMRCRTSLTDTGIGTPAFAATAARGRTVLAFARGIVTAIPLGEMMPLFLRMR